jgi:hypothetical protein
VAGEQATARRTSEHSSDRPEPAAPNLDHHGAGVLPRGLRSVTRSSTDQGRFGRMFRSLEPFNASDDLLARLAASTAPTPAGDASPAGDNPDIPAGYTYLGQFIDHDITFDPVSALERRNDPDALTNARTPRFDLDCLFGGGRLQMPYLYDEEDPAKLLVGRNTASIHEPEDLPRNQQGRALLGDPRNDVHVIVSQLHLALIRFHNAVVDHLRDRFTPEAEIVAEARRLTCWHYQWVVVHDFLRRTVGPRLLDEILVKDDRTGAWKVQSRFYSWRRQPFMPVEFSAAAYRFAHSQVRTNYTLNDQLEPIPMFSQALTPNPLQHLGGFRPLPKKWKIDWRKFFVLDGGPPPHASRRIDTKVTLPLQKLPANVDRSRRSLALLDLLRGRALQLPSGQAVAKAMGTAVPDADLGLDGETPLWFYLLREAEVVADGRRLGPTGGRIVAEVLLGLLKGDPSSFLRQAPRWQPDLPAAQPGQFAMPDLLRFAGVA